MAVKPSGIHHVTAIAGNPQRNVDFYTRSLGLRLVKQTVNFDAPHIWHLYYGDESGRPSSVMTFFPWPGVAPGREGFGLTNVTSFSIPLSSIGWWTNHLAKLNVETRRILHTDGLEAIELRDPDGMRLRLVGTTGDARSGWDGYGRIPIEAAIRGIHSVSLGERDFDPTSSMLTDLLGMQLKDESPNSLNFTMDRGNSGAQVELLAENSQRGLQAGGTVHHVAFRAPDLATMTLWQEELTQQGVPVTQIMDRQYFKSIYFREPGGVLFEIATDDPGFDIDEPLLELGRSLKLPPWLEPSREDIQAVLAPISLAEGN